VAAFNFRLASVLRFRERVKEEKQWELSALNATRREMEEQILALEQAALDVETAMAREQGQLFSAAELRLRADYARSLERRIQIQRVALAKFDERIVAKREELVEAMRSVKTLEQLRKRLEQKFRQKENIEQQKFGDQVAQRKFTEPHKRKKLP
jgi:flagellar export protein FliJ